MVRIKLTVILLCLIAFKAVGQSNFYFTSISSINSFKNISTPKFSGDFLKLSLEIAPKFEKNSLPIERKILKPIEPFKYEAFFCRIEQQLCNRFDFWIKIRVGDESTYHRNKAID